MRKRERDLFGGDRVEDVDLALEQERELVRPRALRAHQRHGRVRGVGEVLLLRRRRGDGDGAVHVLRPGDGVVAVDVSLLGVRFRHPNGRRPEMVEVVVVIVARGNPNPNLGKRGGGGTERREGRGEGRKEERREGMA